MEVHNDGNDKKMNEELYHKVHDLLDEVGALMRSLASKVANLKHQGKEWLPKQTKRENLLQHYKALIKIAYRVETGINADEEREILKELDKAKEELENVRKALQEEKFRELEREAATRRHRREPDVDENIDEDADKRLDTKFQKELKKMLDKEQLLMEKEKV